MHGTELNSLSLDELQQFMEEIGEERYRAEQLFTYLHRNRGMTIDDISVFSTGLKDKLKQVSRINNIKIYERLISDLDGTRKYLFTLEDDNIIEGVLMEYRHGLTACISTQVGCRMGCVFCASSKDGLARNLSPAEIANQIYIMENDVDRSITNIVLMGSGEPLDNYDNTLKFLYIIHDEKGHNISYRNITLSTCGIVPNIYKLADEGLPITLSISLHTPFDEDRKKIMPIGHRYTIDDIIKACKYYINQTNRRVTMEYILIGGVNDRIKDQNKLIQILQGMECHVNLIPLNPIEEFDHRKPTVESIYRFQNRLSKANIPTTIRKEMGGDISAACGQLRRRYIYDKYERTLR